MKSPQLTIVILSYNVEPLLLDCLKSIYAAQTRNDNWQVVVVDNASSDNSRAQVKSKFPQVELIENQKNLGFAAGNNVALKKVKTEYTLLLNPDTLVFPKTIQTVISFLQSHPDYGAATCRVELPDGTLDYSSHRGFPNPWNSFVYFFTGLNRLFPTSQQLSSYAVSDKKLNSTHDIDSLTGAFAAIRTSAGQQVGWLDEDYFWNGEDLDFCFRLKQKGWKISFIPEVKITHFKGSSSGLYKNNPQFRPTKSTRAQAVIYGTEAMKIFYRKHYSTHYPFLFNLLVYIGIWFLRQTRLLKVQLT